MAFYLYSPEAFPSKKGGRPHEYIEALGQSFSVEAKSWTKLKGRYTIFRHEDWQDEQGHTYPVFPEELAKEINEKYKHRGVFVTEEAPTSDKAKELVKKAHKRSLKWRQEVVENFESNIARVRMGKPGRTDPTPYESECYHALGLSVPSSIDGLKSQAQPQQPNVMVLTPDVIKAIRGMSPDEVSKLEQKSPTPDEPLAPKSLDEAKKVTKRKHL
jgi:hypothetical protein